MIPTRIEVQLLEALERIERLADSRERNVLARETLRDILLEIQDIAQCAIANVKIEIALRKI